MRLREEIVTLLLHRASLQARCAPTASTDVVPALSDSINADYRSAGGEMTFDRYLRFRCLSTRLSSDGAFVIVRNQGVLATYFEEEHEVTFASLLYPLDGDLLEIEYPAAYGYFLFGPKGDGKWKYTNKTA